MPAPLIKNEDRICINLSQKLLWIQKGGSKNPIDDQPTLTEEEDSFSVARFIPTVSGDDAYMAACSLVNLMVWTAGLKFELSAKKGSNILLFNIAK
jgi:hypothetical protein